MITLAHLRSLLERALAHAENPAIVRLVDRTVEGMARAYLPPHLFIVATNDQGRSFIDIEDIFNWRWCGSVVLHIQTVGTAHALLVALALALGLDPGVGGVGVAWIRTGPFETWRVVVHHTGMYFVPRGSYANEILAPTVAAEPDPIKALALAVLHVLEHP